MTPIPTQGGNKMTFKIIVLSAVILISGPFHNVADAADKNALKQEPSSSASDVPQVGRFQLLNARYSSTVAVNLLSETKMKEGLFIFDTATGSLFECSSSAMKVDGKGYLKNTCSSFESEISFGGK